MKEVLLGVLDGLCVIAFVVTAIGILSFLMYVVVNIIWGDRTALIGAIVLIVSLLSLRGWWVLLQVFGK